MDDSMRTVVNVPLCIEPWQAERINKSLKVASVVYNTTAREILNRYLFYMNREDNKEDSRKLAEAYVQLSKGEKDENGVKNITLTDRKAELKKQLKKNPDNKEIKQQLEEVEALLEMHQSNKSDIFKKRKDDMSELGITKFSILSSLLKNAKHYKNNLPSEVVNCTLVNPLWASFNKLLYGNGEKIQFRKWDDSNILMSRNKSGITFKQDEKGYYLNFANASKPASRKMKIYLKDCSDDFTQELLSRPIVQVGIKRVYEKTKFHYYFVGIVVGNTHISLDENGENVHKVGEGMVSLCLWRNRLAAVSDKEIRQFNLFPENLKRLKNEIKEIDRQITKNRIMNNPDNYNADGTVKTGIIKDGKRQKLKWNNSNTYLRLKEKRRNLYRIYSERRKVLYHNIYYELMEMGDFFVYITPTSNLTKKKDYSKDEKTPTNTEYRKKKERRTSIQTVAPATFFNGLDVKLVQYGCDKVEKISVKDSHYWYKHDIDGNDKDSFVDDKVLINGQSYPHTAYRAVILRHYNSRGYDTDLILEEWERYEPLLRKLGFIPVKDDGFDE